MKVLINYFFLVSFFLTIFKCHSQPTFTIMLDPAGDVSQPGRVIDDTYERGLTLQFCHQLKKELEIENNSIRVVLSRFPGEIIEPLQNASFANRLGVDLFVSIHFYKLSHGINIPNICLYYLLYHPITDFWQNSLTNQFDFIPYDEAYKISILNSEKAVETVENILKKYFTSNSNSVYSFGCPFKPLLGVKAPAMGIEIGLVNKNNWHDYVNPIANSLSQVATEFTRNVK